MTNDRFLGRTHRWWGRVALATAAVACCLVGAPRQAEAQHPSWLNSAVIYGVNPEIFSTSGFSGVTSQITRLKNLGVNVIWLMPIYPRGVAVNGHPSFNSPYCIQNFQAVNPNFGTSADLTNLITTAHNNGMKVILDAVCNHTSWDNALITSHPEYYVHTDGNSTNVNSIAAVNGLSDVAQLNYGSSATVTYMTNVLKWWITTYNVDGFRFDYADYPVGSGASMPKSFWTSLRPALESVKSDILMLGEEQDVNLATTPFEVDYGWNMYSYGTLAALTHSLDATTLQYQWQWPYTINVAQPAGMKHMNIQDDWDLDRDVVKYGGNAQAMAAAAFDFTIDGIPLLYNGMEAANNNGGVNSHTQINWSGSAATTFATFYTRLLALRNGSAGALQQGGTTWVTNSAPSQVSSYYRGSSGNEYLVEINTAAGTVTGTLSPPGSGTWTDVTPPGAPGGTTHTAPPNFSLQGYDFAIFHRGTASAPPAPTGLTATAGNAQVALAWSASSGATSYNVYRGTAAGAEGTTALASGVTAAAYTNTGLTNGTKYYYKVAAVNSTGTSAQSTEASATPAASTSGSLSGSVSTVSTATTYNLTSLGTSDWTAWAYNNAFNHSSAGGSKLSDISASGGSLNVFTSGFLGFTWTNGTPTTSATGETNGFYNPGTGNGFTFTAPAGTTSQTLTVYVGGWSSGGTLTATLSDGSAATYTNSSLSNTSNSYYGFYTLTYKAASAGKLLTVTWKQASGTGNVTMYAAALH